MRRLSSIVLMIGVAFSSPTALFAKAAYRCVSPSGEVSFEQRPCKDGVSEKVNLDFIPAPKPEYKKTEQNKQEKLNANTKKENHSQKEKSLKHAKQCLALKQKLAQVERELDQALRTQKRAKLEIDAKWLEEQVDLVCEER